MDEFQNQSDPLEPREMSEPTPAATAYDTERNAEEAWRRNLRRRLLALLCVMCAAFAVSTWLLVRYENPLWLASLTNGPAGVVRDQLEALNRGDLRAAYNQFSVKYRQQVPFEAFHELVVQHRNMFHTRQLRIGRDDESGGRAVLETHLLADGGKRYLARFTLVRLDGRWWVDDLHWSEEPLPRPKLRA
jgi:hypothetical protein